MTPAISAPHRRWPLARLGALTVVEAGFLALAGLFLGDVIAGLSGPDPGASLIPALMLAGAALFGAASAWTRAVFAEDFGARFANEARAAMAQDAIVRGGARRRLGVIAVRMTGDLTPLRLFAATGVSDGAAGAAFALAGWAVIAATLGWIGAFVGVLIFALWRGTHARIEPSLRARLRSLRSARGAMGALAGDLALAGAAIARFGALRREVRRFNRRAERLRAESVARRRLAAALAAPGQLAVAVAALVIALAYVAAIPMPALSGADWAQVFYGASLMAAGFVSLARAGDAHSAYLVARERMAELEEGGQAAWDTNAPAPQARERLAPVSLLALERGGVRFVSSQHPARAMQALEALATLDDPTMRIGFCAPSLPLVRGSIRRNLSLHDRTTPRAHMEKSMSIAGLDLIDWPLNRRIDPALDDPDPWTQARLRLARALAQSPRLIVVAEPLLYFDPDASRFFRRVALESGAALIAATSERIADAVDVEQLQRTICFDDF